MCNHFSFSVSENTRLKCKEFFFTPTDHEIEKKLRMSFTPLTPSDLIKQGREEEKDQ